jgi:hypothetical protein
VRSEGQITVPVGDELETWLYVVSAVDEDGKETQSLYHFAKTWPGPPVLTTITVDGKMTKRITMVGRR